MNESIRENFNQIQNFSEYDFSNSQKSEILIYSATLEHEQLNESVFDAENSQDSPSEQVLLDSMLQVSQTQPILQKSKSEVFKPISSEINESASVSGHSIALAMRSDESVKVTNYCKKYFKLKYEIEVQNFLIDKFNRELLMKTSQWYPECELERLRHNLKAEIMKLHHMIDNAIWVQRGNQHCEFGAIPISLVTNTTKLPLKLNCKEYVLPQKPSNISNVSGFSKIENDNFGNLAGKHTDEYVNEDKAIFEVHEEIQLMEYEIIKLKQQNDKLAEEINMYQKSSSDDNEVSALQSIKSSISSLIIRIQAIKTVCDKVHTKIHLIRNLSK